MGAIPGPNIPGGSYYPEIARDHLRGQGSPSADAVSDEPSSEYHENFDRREHWSWRSVGIGVGIFVAVVVLLVSFLFVIPFSHSFSGVATPMNGSPPVFLFPQGSQVKFSWQSVSDTPITFQVFTNHSDLPYQPLGVIYNVTAVSGSFSFTSAGLYYDFGTSSTSGDTATFSGSYQAPLYTLWGQPNFEVP